MMREIVSTLTGIFIALYFMYFMYPMLSTTHTNFSLLVNSSDATIAQSYTLGQGFYEVIPWLPIIAAGFILINVALRRDTGE